MYKRTYSGITALFFAMAALLMAPGSADAGDSVWSSPATGLNTVPTSVCETRFRGQPEYDRTCLRRGVVGDAGAIWYGIPKGRKSDVHDDARNRHSICAYAGRHGGIDRAATEAVTDMTYDAFHNNRSVDRWVTSMARVDCAAMGYRL